MKDRTSKLDSMKMTPIVQLTTLSFLKILGLFFFAGTVQSQTIGLTNYTIPNTEGYVLFAPVSNTQTYLIDKCGNEVHSWPSDYKPGLSVYLSTDGTLFRTGSLTTPYFGVGAGKGGILERINWDGTVAWSYQVSDSLQCQHHDAKLLPNGNILVIVWEMKSLSECTAAGKNPIVTAAITDQVVWSEKIIELQPIGTNSATIVWEWHLWDHLAQDFDATKSNFGTVADHPELVDVNYVQGPATSADWIHFNSIDYNSESDQILLSTHNLSEIWIIDHSTTSIEAASHSGGNSAKGGDFLYRWGNPMVYDRGTATEQQLFKQHHATWIPTGNPNAGKILVFNNGVNRPGGNASSVDIIDIPDQVNNNYPIGNGVAYEPTTPFWTYQDPIPTDFFAINISGVYPLDNGSFIITNGPKGTAFEINSNEEKVWEYINPVTTSGPMTQGATPTANSVFRFNYYPANYQGFSGQNLIAGSEIELNPIDPPLCGDLGAQLLEESMFSIFPNPATTEIGIVTPSTNEETMLQLFDIHGQCVLHQTLQLGESELKLSVSDFQKGIYFLVISNQTTELTERIILQ